jgi:hypothetical protein
MIKLTKSQLEFISKNGITTNDLFYVAGMKNSEWKQKMKDEGKLIAYGANPCTSGGHTLKTRAGHCPQCNPAAIAFLRRHSDEGDVYVAWSSKGKIAKIGCTKNAYSRIESLISTEYGGQTDWTLKLVYECTEAGLVEKLAQKILKKFAIKDILYVHDGKNQIANELFCCSIAQAKNALEQAVADYLK